jgi:phenylacetate-CoA ligase
MPLEALRAGQLASLQELFAAIVPANRFYTAKLGGLATVQSLEEFSARVGFTTKRELIDDQAAHPPYGTNLTYPLDQYTRFSQTSATTGKPLRWLDTDASWSWMLDNWTRVFRAAGVGRGDRVFFAFSFGPFLGFWTAFDAATQMDCLAIPGGGMRSASRLRLLLDSQATVLCCTPTYAIHLAEIAREEEIDLSESRVRTIVVAGEPGGSIPATRRAIEQLWPGASVMDHHGMTEVGPVSYGCPARPGVLHVIESAYLAEILDPATGEAVPAGTMGELVLTNLGRAGSPLLRYRTGDLVQASTERPCACGSCEVALEGGILGRTDDMVVVRGVNVYPGAVEDILRSCGGIAEYRVTVSVIRGLAELSIEFEPQVETDGDPHLPHRLESALKDAFALRIPVVAAPRGSLPRFEMKARRWVFQR